MMNSLKLIAQAAVFVAREVDHVLALASIDNAREAVAQADRRRAIRSVLADLESDTGALIEIETKDEFIDRLREVQMPVTFGR